MPIANVMERGTQLPRIGSLRKGKQVPVIDKDTNKPKQANGRAVMRPTEVPYWVFSIDPKLEPRLEEVYKAYGTREISDLRVFLPYPDVLSNFDFWLEAYTASQLVARSDGTTLTFLRDITTGQILVKNSRIVAKSSKPKSPAGKLVEDLQIGGVVPYQEGMIVAVPDSGGDPILLKASGRLQVVEPVLAKALGIFAILTVHTGSQYVDMPQILAALQMVSEIARLSGRPANTIPLRLLRVPQEISAPVGKDGIKRQRVTKYFIQLHPTGDIVAGLLETYSNTPFDYSMRQLAAAPSLPEFAAESESLDEDMGDVDVTASVVEEADDDDQPKQSRLLPRGDVYHPPAETQPLAVAFVVPSKDRQWKNATLKAVVEGGYAANLNVALGMLNLSNLPGDAPDEIVLGWCELYRQKRPKSGIADKRAPSSAEAAEYANDQAFKRWGGMVAQAIAEGGDYDDL